MTTRTLARITARIVAAAGMLIHGLSAQQLAATKVPAAVRQSLQSRFAGAKAVEWKLKSDGNYEAEFKNGGADVAVKFAPAGNWLETETTIGAITMPDAVRAAVVKAFKGYRIVETQRLDRAASPRLLYEVHVENQAEVVKAQLDPAGTVTSRTAKPVAVPVVPAVSLVGTWRGESRCLPGYEPCQNEKVVYRIVGVANDPAGFDVHVSKVVDDKEAEAFMLACTLDRSRATLGCLMALGTWQFQLRHDSLIGGLTLRDGKPARRVAVRRDP